MTDLGQRLRAVRRFVVVPEDCVGPMQKQYHEEAMAVLRRLAVPTRSAEIVEAWKRA